MRFLRSLFVVDKSHSVRPIFNFCLIFFSCNAGSASIVTGYDCAKTNDINIQTFELSVFRFTGSTPEDLIYFHCQAAVCLRNNINSLCTTQCNACDGGGMKRRKRFVEDQSRDDLAEENLVLGPYQIIDNDNDNDTVVDVRTKEEGMLVSRLLSTFDDWEDYRLRL